MDKPPNRNASGAPTRGFTFIEIIGVLAVIAILAAVLLPALIKEVDKAVSDKETATLASLSDAVQQYALRYRSVSNAPNWTIMAAAQLGINSSDLTLNPRNRSRFFVIDGSGWLTNTPFVQDAAGTSSPFNPRAMLLTSLGSPLPNTIANGTLPNATDFANIWNSTDGTVPPATVFTGWQGSGQDLKVQRINLTPMFVHLILSTYGSSTNGYYSIDGGPTNVVTTSGLDAYFLQNTVLNLYYQGANSSTNLDSQQILIRDQSFVFYQNQWRANVTGSGQNQVGVFDFTAVVNAFLAAPPNTSAGASTQQAVVQSFIDYMNAYNAWAAENATTSGPWPKDSVYGNAVYYYSNMVWTVKRIYAARIPTPY
jgi:prepilin-type N-terminal cleavage/methylation domain-containing protein